MAAETIDGPSMRTFVIGAILMAGVALDEETLATLLPELDSRQ